MSTKKKRNLDELYYDIEEPMDNTILTLSGGYLNNQEMQNLQERQAYNNVEFAMAPLRFLPYIKYATDAIDFAGVNPRNLYNLKQTGINSIKDITPDITDATQGISDIAVANLNFTKNTLPKPGEYTVGGKWRRAPVTPKYFPKKKITITPVDYANSLNKVNNKIKFAKALGLIGLAGDVYQTADMLKDLYQTDRAIEQELQQNGSNYVYKTDNPNITINNPTNPISTEQLQEIIHSYDKKPTKRKLATKKSTKFIPYKAAQNKNDNKWFNMWK